MRYFAAIAITNAIAIRAVVIITQKKKQARHDCNGLLFLNVYRLPSVVAAFHHCLDFDLIAVRQG